MKGMSPGIYLGIYKSHEAKNKDVIMHLEKLIEDLGDQNAIFTCIGDFNINYAKNTSSVKNLKTVLIEHNMEQIIDKFTRVDKESATIIDYVITNNKKNQLRIFGG